MRDRFHRSEIQPWRNTRTTAFASLWRPQRFAVLYLLMLGISNIKSSFFLLFEHCPNHEELWYGKKQLFWFSLMRAEAITHGAHRADHLVSICRLEKRFFPQLEKNKQWHSFQLMCLFAFTASSLFSPLPINSWWNYYIIPWKLPMRAGVAASRRWLPDAGVQLTVSANVKWQGLWSQGNNRGRFYFPELPEKLSG